VHPNMGWTFDIGAIDVGATVVWLVANVVYVNMKRKGLRGFTRFVAFWLGTPTTWLSFFLLPEGRQPKFDTPPDDDEELFREVRRDRALRAAREGKAPALEESRTETPPGA